MVGLIVLDHHSHHQSQVGELNLSHDSTVNPNEVFIRELSLLGDDYSLIDNNDITKEEVSHIIRHLCTS